MALQNLLALTLAVAVSGLVFAAADPRLVPPPAASEPGSVLYAETGTPRPAARIGFPPIKDWRSLKMELARGPCFGWCPAYSVAIQGDGTVTYEGDDFALVKGHHVTHLAPQRVHALFEAFRKADFFWLHDSYASTITDNPTFFVTLSYDGYRKRVRDYAGLRVLMPIEVQRLEEAIDAAAGTGKWVTGNRETVSALRAEGWNFHSSGNANISLLPAATQNGQSALVADLLAAGVPVGGRGRGSSCHAAENAARRGDLATLRALLQAGAPVHARYRDLSWRDRAIPAAICDVLMAAAGRGGVAGIALVLARHPDVNWVDVDGDTALTVVSSIYVSKTNKSGIDLAQSASLLLKAGAHVDYRAAQNGRSALMLATRDAMLVRVLLKAGAKDVNVLDGQGMTSLMNADNAEVVRALLEGGADPWVRSKDGHTALELAHFVGRPASEAVLRDWMARHPKKP